MRFHCRSWGQRSHSAGRLRQSREKTARRDVFPRAPACLRLARLRPRSGSPAAHSFGTSLRESSNRADQPRRTAAPRQTSHASTQPPGLKEHEPRHRGRHSNRARSSQKHLPTGGPGIPNPRVRPTFERGKAAGHMVPVLPSGWQAFARCRARCPTWPAREPERPRRPAAVAVAVAARVAAPESQDSCGRLPARAARLPRDSAGR